MLLPPLIFSTSHNYDFPPLVCPSPSSSSSFFAFHNNRDLKLIWMNIEISCFVAKYVCVCCSCVQLWTDHYVEISFLLFFNISLLCISFKPFPMLPHLYKLMNWSHSLPAVTANSKGKKAVRFRMFIDKTKRRGSKTGGGGMSKKWHKIYGDFEKSATC